MPWLYGHLTYLISCLALMGSLVREILNISKANAGTRPC